MEEINNSVWCKLSPSKIHGIGVFAIRDIPKGQKLSDHEFESLEIPKIFTVSFEDFNLIRPEIRSLILDRILIPDGIPFIPFLSPNSNQILQSFMNHSSTPNSDGHYALCDIKMGEEVTEDYHFINNDWHRLTKERMSGII